MKIEILCTGDEILSGKTTNTNYSYMARQLVENGFDVCWGTTVGDDRQSLVDAFQQASARANVVIVNGGLGPTVDDLSQEVAATAAGVELVLHEEWYNRIAAWYQSRGRKMPQNNTKQAMLPSGAEFIDNPIGTACGFAVDIGTARFFFTPGVPREMFRMMDEQVMPRLKKMRGGDIVTRVKRFHTFGIGESRADQMLNGVEDMVDGNRVKLGFQSHYPQLETKLTARGDSEEELDRMLAPLETAVRERLGNFIVCEDDHSIESNIHDHLSMINGSIVVAEMHSAGEIATRLLTTVDDPKRVKPGIVSLDLLEIEAYVGSRPNRHGLPDLEYAADVAEKLREKTAATHALVVLVNLVVTDEIEQGAGDVFIGISDGAKTRTRLARLPGSHRWIRAGASELGLDCLRRFLAGQPVNEKIDFEQH